MDRQISFFNYLEFNTIKLFLYLFSNVIMLFYITMIIY